MSYKITRKNGEYYLHETRLGKDGDYCFVPCNGSIYSYSDKNSGSGRIEYLFAATVEYGDGNFPEKHPKAHTIDKNKIDSMQPFKDAIGDVTIDLLDALRLR